MSRPNIASAQVVIACEDFDATLAFLTDRLGFRVDSIFPADAPTVAGVSGHGLALRLEAADQSWPVTLRVAADLADFPEAKNGKIVGPGGLRVVIVQERSELAIPEGEQRFIVTRFEGENGWGVGRAGMLYRDLIPGRLGGRFIASHIRIPDGGPVPDYVHFHKVRFQMIFCKRGWARLVYEDQGEPFILNAGDCVLQPPEIRHRVLEASEGLEVIEIGCPAIHETVADHELTLPTEDFRPDRQFGGQWFVRFVANETPWMPAGDGASESRETGIREAAVNLAGARVIRSVGSGVIPRRHDGEFHFLFLLQGAATLDAGQHGTHELLENDAVVIPTGTTFKLAASAGFEALEVTLPG